MMKRTLQPIATLFACFILHFSASGATGATEGMPPTDAERNRILLERAQWLYRQRALPTGEIPAGARARALGQIKKARRNVDSLTASTPTERWVNIGPAPILNGQLSPRQPVSGRVADIAIDPLDTNHWLIGAAQGGIWETRDAGANWRPLTDDQPSLAMGAITYAPGHPNIIYAGTGEAAFSGVSYAGAGLLKSENGGQFWHLLGADAFAQSSFSGIRVNPNDPDRLVVATAWGRAGGLGYYISLSPPTGVLTSDDGGTNWTLRLPGHASDLEVHPGDFDRQYAALGSIFGVDAKGAIQSSNGVYRSHDAGLTWNRIDGPWDALSNRLGRIEMALAPSDPGVLYVSATTTIVFQGWSGSGGTLEGIWRTANAWEANPTWVRLPTPSSTGQAWYHLQLSVHPTNANVLYLGATALHRYNGSSWAVLGGDYDGNNSMRLIHADQHAIAWAGSRLVVGNDGGVWSSINDGVSWNNHNAGLDITQFYFGSLHPSNANVALGGSQDNGTEKWTGSNAWLWIESGDGCESAFSSRNPDTHWAVSWQNSTIRRTLNGSTFTDAFAGIDRVNAPFVTQFAKHPTLDDLFIHGTDRLWKCTNFFSGSPFWYSNSTVQLVPVTTNDFVVDIHTDMLPDQISAMTFAASDATGDTYAYATTFANLRLTTDGGRNWIDLDPTNAVPDRYITDIAFDPNDANVLWLTLSSFNDPVPLQAGHVFKTTNALSGVPAWQNVSPPVDIPHNSIAIDPVNPNHVFVGTDIGVWQTTDGGANWTHMGPETGMPNVAVFELELNEPTERLVAFTHGRGAFALMNPDAASLRVTQDVSGDPVLPGCDLTYTVRVHNFGPREATGVTLADTLPAGANFISATPSQGACTQTAGVVSCDLGTLPAQSDTTVTVVVSPLSEGMMTNQASVTANEAESSPDNNATTLVAAAAVTLQPPSLAVVENTGANFSVVGGGDCPDSAFQWQFNGMNLPNATNATLLLTNVSAGDDGEYRVVLHNGAGTFTSSPAPLTVLFLPRVVTSPQSLTVVAGEDVTFDVTASGSLPMTYEWRRLSTPLATNTVFALSNSFTLFNVAPSQDGERYRVILRNAARPTGVASSYATLMVTTPPAPLATTEAADGVGSDTAVLHGLANPNGGPSWVFFDYGETTNYETRTAALSLPKGSNALPITQTLTELIAETTYHYRLVATNYGGIALGDDQVFSTTAAELRITGFERLDDGRFRLEFLGRSGTVYTVMASPNLARWDVAGTASETEPGQFEFIDAEAPGHPTRFYRLQSPSEFSP
jgi:uncharacterized repeat protein (TIGR01451 family)